MADERPDPILKAAEASSLPRAARARIGQTTDPVPEGKVLDTEPKHHLPITPAGHDVERSQPKSPNEMGLAQVGAGEALRAERDTNTQEIYKMQQEEGRLKGKGGTRGAAEMDWQGAATSANKKMESRHRHADLNIGRHDKHLDSVRRDK